jgi:class III poly(R)-hydroxyalkanoic acid synthase PhaE subunit
MAQKQPNAGDWIGGWIEQQRELLRQQAAAGGPASMQDLGRRWLDLGESYLKGLSRFGEGGGTPGDTFRPDPGQASAAAQFKLGEDILCAWRSAWAGAEQEHAGLGRGFAELMDRLPFLGLAREQAQAWRELSAAQAECRRLGQELSTVLSRVQSDVLALLEQRVREREQAGKPIADFRALYDLWVECGEQVYSQVAHSEAYSRLQAELGNATMRLRSRQQAVIEHALKQFDLPTRAELNTVHLQLRELRSTLAAMKNPARSEARTQKKPPSRTPKPAAKSRKKK